MSTEAIILAGGLGTRLSTKLPGLPKVLAPVNGRPFLFYLLNHLRAQGIEKFIISTGHLSAQVSDYLGSSFSTLNYEVVKETEPLGTGGGILLASSACKNRNVFVQNGDTIFKCDLEGLMKAHKQQNAECTIALKPMENFDRYGVVETDQIGRITAFRDKRKTDHGLINGGIYVLDLDKFHRRDLGKKFSFEKDYLEKFVGEGKFFGRAFKEYFIDIGIPEDHEKADKDFARPGFGQEIPDKSWTIFLDRDGVINHERRGEYVRSWAEFRFMDKSLEAIARLSQVFGRVIVVSNQRGVEKGLMTEDDLNQIHKNMVDEIRQSGGRIDQIYYTTSIDDKHAERKPNPGMLFKAFQDFPAIDPSRCIIAGNKLSDMAAGKHAGIYTVFVASTNPETPFPHPDIDARFDSLFEFADSL